MSLIREALDRARRESSTPPPRLPGGPIPWTAHAGRRRSRAGAVAGVLFAATVGAAAAWWLRPTAPPAPPPLSAAAAEPRADSQASRLPTPTPSIPTPAEVPPAEVPADSQPAAAADVPNAPPAPAALLPRPAPNPPRLESRYVSEIPLPEGGSLSLDGLVSSAANPVAVINGRLLSPGDIVQGFEVLSIGATEVELRRDGRVVTLVLR